MDKGIRNNIKILIVEDEKQSALMLKSMLEKIGYVISGIVETGEESIKKAKELKPDLVLMDITLSGKVDGINAANQIVTEFEIPSIFLTAASDSATFERAKKAMPLGYILKPFNSNMLQATVEMSLHRYEIEKKLHKSEKRNEEIISIIPDTLFNLKTDGTFATGEDADIGGKIWPHLVAKKAIPYIEKAQEKNEIQIFEYALKSDRDIRYFEARLIHKDDNSVLVVARDVSEKKKAELELTNYKNTLENRVAERTKDLKLFNHIINQSPNIIVIIGKNGVV